MEQQPLIPEVLPPASDEPNEGNGRPRGATNRRYRELRRIAEAEAVPILQKLVAQAKAGDTIAAKIILDRVWPRPRTTPIEISLPSTRNPAEIRAAMHDLIAQIAAGEVEPVQGAAFMEILGRVLEAHRIQTFDPVSVTEIGGADHREQVTNRLLKLLEERKTAAAAAQAPPEPAGE